MLTPLPCTALAIASLVAVSFATAGTRRGGGTDLLGVSSGGGAYAYLNGYQQALAQQQTAGGDFLYREHPSVDFASPASTGLQSGAVEQQQLATVQEMARPSEAPNYNSGEGMTYTPSTQTGVSDKDQSPAIPTGFLDDEKKSKKRMKRLAKLLKKSAKKQDELDLQVCSPASRARWHHTRTVGTVEKR